MPVAHPVTRGVLPHAGQILTLLAVGIMAAGAAPARREGASAPIAPAPAPVVAVAEPAGPVTASLLFAAPIAGYPVNSRFGLRRLPGESAARPHQGLDYAAPAGAPVLATAPGKVVRTGYEPTGYGRFVEVLHGEGLTSFYAHLSRIEVRPGDRLEAGQLLGRVGSTGFSTGPHLHFEVRRGERRLNPARVLGRVIRVEAAA
ncbi:MAG TPA: M23 family metallopeptidase [Brevundimonas sp.]|jgi:murein DD-endopeptidase MepM/ murein hydrolase activator NlpD|uniref:M23 family metallopeptidase n=1 Tax=Brevundimonas sp. TaxID=1871086 RepID=UPI002E13C606|nr:M23 family metallopeptidase [Brevundimonas sp.]